MHIVHASLIYKIVLYFIGEVYIPLKFVNCENSIFIRKESEDYLPQLTAIATANQHTAEQLSTLDLTISQLQCRRQQLLSFISQSKEERSAIALQSELDSLAHVRQTAINASSAIAKILEKITQTKSTTKALLGECLAMHQETAKCLDECTTGQQEAEKVKEPLGERVQLTDTLHKRLLSNAKELKAARKHSAKREKEAEDAKRRAGVAWKSVEEARKRCDNAEKKLEDSTNESAKCEEERKKLEEETDAVTRKTVEVIFQMGAAGVHYEIGVLPVKLYRRRKKSSASRGSWNGGVTSGCGPLKSGLPQVCPARHKR